MSDDIEIPKSKHIEVNKIECDGDNPNEMSDESFESLKNNISRYGFHIPIITDKDLVVADGEHRLKAAKDLGLSEVPVVALDVDRADRKILRQVHNKLRGDHDEEKDKDELDRILDAGRKDDLNVLLGGNDDIDKLLDNTNEEQEILESERKPPKDIQEWKILNLYAGIGGNRKFWPDECDITHLEYNQKIADALEELYPDDTVICDDAHDYLEYNFDKYDFIWSSPPCPTHSRMRKQIAVGNNAKPKYPDMNLYEEILFLKGYFEGKWIVENVKSWYEPLIEPQQRDRHYYWSNFTIPSADNLQIPQEIGSIDDWHNINLQNHTAKFGYTEEEYQKIPNPTDYPKEKIIRNMVHPNIGEKILYKAFKESQKSRNDP